MARNDDSQHNGDTPKRVYKSSDVHRRRIDRKSIPSPKPEQPAGASSNQQADEQPKQAVVIAPDFGTRTKADREADDRWFAAMREQANAEASASQHETPVEANAGEAPISAKPAETPSEAATEPPATDTAQVPPIADDAAAPTPEVPTGDQKPADDQEPADDRKPQPHKRPSARMSGKKGTRIGIIIGAVVLVAAIIAALLFVWNRWYRFDDHADMQGEWYVIGTTVPVTIDESSIHLNDEVTYAYAIDAHDKTIDYTFGPMKGHGRYWISDDRRFLVITDGDEFTASGTAADDVIQSLSNVGSTVSGENFTLPAGEGIIAFSRNPDFAASVHERISAGIKTATEEKERQEEERRAAEEAAAWEAEYYYYEE